MTLSIKQLRAFMALYEQRNFTRAAADVCLSQPAFSALINGLEAEVGFRLFDRDTRQVRIAPDGEAFFQIARQYIRLHEASVQEIEAMARGERGRVCVATLPSLAASWLPVILPAFRERFPKVRVELIDAPSDRCLQAVRDGLADFACTPSVVADDGFVCEKLCSERFYFVCPEGHPLAEQRAVRVEQLKGLTLLSFAQTTSIRQHVGPSLPKGAWHDSLEVEQLTTMMGLISAGLGASIIPELALYQFRMPGIVIRPLEDFDAQREIHLIVRADSSLSVAAQNFRDAFTNHAKTAYPSELA